MSIKWISYIWDKTDYKEGELLTALALADFADDSGFCYPFMDQLAKKARIGVRQVQKILQRLEVDGLIEITRFQGRGKRPQFQLKKVNSDTPFSDRKKVNSETLKGELYDIKKVNSETFPIYKDEPSLKPSLNRQDAEEGEAKKAHPVHPIEQGRGERPLAQAAVNPNSEAENYEEMVFRGLQNYNVVHPLNIKDWQSAIYFAFEKQISSKAFIACVRWLKTDKENSWRKVINARSVMDTICDFAQKQVAEPKRKTAREYQAEADAIVAKEMGLNQ